MFQPRFQITPAIAKALIEVEAGRQVIVTLPMTASMLSALRETARLLATHYSTQIEGNRLTQAQVQVVLQGGGRFHGRARDEQEVKNYYRALAEVEKLGQQQGPITAIYIQRIHGLVLEGRRHLSPYRDGQNVIRDGSTRRMIYMPPEAADVPALMTDLVQWINQETARQELLVPIIAALAHYQFATIHPYYDGNGRTARLLTTLILHRQGYGLKGIYALEEYYAHNLQGYYDALTVGPSHNYYEGRAEADVTGFVTYFCTGMAEAFAKVRAQAEKIQGQGMPDQSPILRELNAQQRKALVLFQHARQITAGELAAFFAISPRNASDLCGRWVREGVLVVANPSKKARRYQLAPRYEALCGG
ncbi:MAG: Fic family protein [Candidatus Binatia bacterium]